MEKVLCIFGFSELGPCKCPCGLIIGVCQYQICYISSFYFLQNFAYASPESTALSSFSKSTFSSYSALFILPKSKMAIYPAL